ncbi:P-loop containing nucleoside triphosphate hydrolase protein [Trametopsis cervina]|nr:P-loop containing nucleoside triphosphate hydrolase protein [Trametopsis cervina]
MQTRSSVLGKRHASPEVPSPSTPSKTSSIGNRDASSLPTPDTTPNPKRMKMSTTLLDGDNNKENIPPLRVEAINSLAPLARTPRSLRRNQSEYFTPSHRRSSLRRHASLSQLPITPASALSHLSLTTPPPTPPSSLQPISFRVRALLRPTCNGIAPLSGREAERKIIANFISSFLHAPSEVSDHTILYISGSPGTGKTALVNSLLGDMRDDLSDASVAVVTVNCMALNSMDALLERLIEEFGAHQKQSRKGGKSRKTKDTTLQSLGTLLDETTRRCILLLDELDHVASSTTALTTLFTLIHSHPKSLRVIGIANTHTLSSTSVATSMSTLTLTGVHTLHFSPYTPQQLLEIIQSRLAPLRDIESPDECGEQLSKFLPNPTLALLTKKVAALTGDVRALLEVLRGAINIAVNTAVPSGTGANPLDVPTPSVTPGHILDALKAYSPASSTSRVITGPSLTSASPVRNTGNNEVFAKLRELGLQSRITLLAIVLARKRLDAHLPLTGSPSASPSATPRSTKRASSSNTPSASSGVDVGLLYSYYKVVLSRSEGGAFVPVSRSEFGDLLGMLETVGLIQLSSLSSSPRTPTKSAKRSLSRTASFGTGPNKGGQEVTFVEGVRVEEVRRGLGIEDAPLQDKGDVMAEELRAIWEKESARISRESKARPSNNPLPGRDAFVDAFED